jgi:hypothetical protein
MLEELSASVAFGIVCEAFYIYMLLKRNKQ